MDWGIDGIESVEVPALGTMNETWLVRCSNQRVVLRRHRRPDKASVAFEHQVIEHARTHRIPCPRVILTLRGERIVERGSRLHSLYSWEPGAHAQRGQAGSVRAYAAGQMLATIHDALSTISEAPADNAGPGDLAETYCRMTHLEDAVRSVAVVGHEWIVQDLNARRTWLDANPHASSQCAGNPQVIHGDYQLTNLLFDGNAISAVIDWDKARVASPLMEVVRSLDHGSDWRGTTAQPSWRATGRFGPSPPMTSLPPSSTGRTNKLGACGHWRGFAWTATPASHSLRLHSNRSPSAGQPPGSHSSASLALPHTGRARAHLSATPNCTADGFGRRGERRVASRSSASTPVFAGATRPLSTGISAPCSIGLRINGDRAVLDPPGS